MKFTKDIYFNRKLTEDTIVNIFYTGKLYKNGSDKVYIVYKYGINCDVEYEKEMTLSKIGYVVDILIDGKYTFDFYFRNENDIVDKNKNEYYIATIFPKVNNFENNVISDSDFLLKEIDGLEDIQEDVKKNVKVRKIEKTESKEEIKEKTKKNIKINDSKDTKVVDKTKISKGTKTSNKTKIAKESKVTNTAKKVKELKTNDKLIKAPQLINKTIETKEVKNIDKTKKINETKSNNVTKKNNQINIVKKDDSLFNAANSQNKNDLGQSRMKQFEDEHKTKVKIKKFIFFEKDKRRRAAVRSLCVIVLFFCIGYGASYYMELKNVQKESQDLLNSVVIDNTAIVKEDVFYEENKEFEEIKNNKSERMLQVKELNNQYPELKAWIEIEGTKINYPVMQGQNNNFYMNHDYKKSYSRWGALFIDSSYVWNPASSNKLIYGHNFSDGAMLSDLLKYKDEDFYYEHPSIRFTTPEEDAEYEIIAVFNSRVYYESETDVFKYYYFVNAEDRDEYTNFVNNAKAASLYKIRKAAVYGEELLTLSTCDYSQKDGRFVVVARKKY